MRSCALGLPRIVPFWGIPAISASAAGFAPDGSRRRRGRGRAAAAAAREHDAADDERRRDDGRRSDRDQQRAAPAALRRARLRDGGHRRALCLRGPARRSANRLNFGCGSRPQAARSRPGGYRDHLGALARRSPADARRHRRRSDRRALLGARRDRQVGPEPDPLRHPRHRRSRSARPSATSPPAGGSWASSSTTPGRCGSTTSPATRARSASHPTIRRCTASSASR